MASVLAHRTRLACASQVRSISMGGGGWLGKLFEKPDTPTQTPGPNKLAASSPSSTINEASTPVIIKKSTKRKPLSANSKALRFQENIEFMTQRLRPRPDPKMSKVGKATWLHTLGVCQTEEDLRKLMEFFPLWRAMSRRFNGVFSEALVCRCIALDKPEIAIEIFGNYAKYNVPLTLGGARRLLQATYETHPLVIPITISSYYSTYCLRRIDNDIPSCSMLLSACLQDGSENAMVIAENLTAKLKKALAKADPWPIPETEEKGEAMHRVWTKWATRKIEEKLSSREGSDVEWLHDFRVKSGYVAATPIPEDAENAENAETPALG